MSMTPVDYPPLGASGLKVQPAVAGHDDVRRPHRRGRGRAHRRCLARGRAQRHRHRRRLCRRRIRAHHRPTDRRGAQRTGCWPRSWPTPPDRGRTNAACRDATCGPRSTPACSGWAPTGSTCCTCTATTRARRWKNRWRRWRSLSPAARCATSACRTSVPGAWPAWWSCAARRVCRSPSPASRPTTPCRGRSSWSCCRPARTTASAWSPTARWRAACSAASTPPDAPPPEGSRAARNDRRILQTEFRPESVQAGTAVRRLCRTQGQHADAAGAGLGVEQPDGAWPHRRAAHARPVAGLPGRSRPALRRRGRGLRLGPGGGGPRVHARLHRRAISGHRPDAGDGLSAPGRHRARIPQCPARWVVQSARRGAVKVFRRGPRRKG